MCIRDSDYPGHGNPVADESAPLFRAAEAEPGQRQVRALDAPVRGRGGDPGHDASRHIRGHGEVRDRTVAPYPTSTISSRNWCSRSFVSGGLESLVRLTKSRPDSHLRATTVLVPAGRRGTPPDFECHSGDWDSWELKSASRE